jgi:hypothetical protein
LETVDFTGAAIKSLTDVQKEGILQWRKNVLTQQGKQGLWLHGLRRSGTSHAAKVVVGRLVYREHLFQDAEHVEALDLVQAIRSMWTINSQSRAHEDDYGLWSDAMSTEMSLDHLWYKCSLLWVDDFHHLTLEGAIWKKSIQPYLERRVKHGMATVVAGTCPPEIGYLPARVVEGLFVTVECDHHGTG